MIVARYVTGAVWAIAAVVGGCVLAISPWMMGWQQTGVPLSTETWNLVGAGAAMVVLGAITFVAVHGILAGDLRAAGVSRRGAPEPVRMPEPLVPAPAAPAPAAPGDDALTQLAHVLAAELARSDRARTASAGVRG